MIRMCALSFLAALLLPACELNQNNSLVGSSGDTKIQGVVFSIDTTYLEASPTRLVCRGRARNGGTSTISSPWYIEGQFYTDMTYRTKLGGNYTRVNVPLAGGQEYLWSITFSSSNVDVRQYPNFGVRDLRAIYKN